MDNYILDILTINLTNEESCFGHHIAKISTQLKKKFNKKSAKIADLNVIS